MSTHPATSFVSIADYLAFEETSEQKHEYHDGAVLAVDPSTYRHARVCTDLTGGDALQTV